MPRCNLIIHTKIRLHSLTRNVGAKQINPVKRIKRRLNVLKINDSLTIGRMKITQSFNVNSELLDLQRYLTDAIGLTVDIVYFYVIANFNNIEDFKSL